MEYVIKNQGGQYYSETEDAFFYCMSDATIFHDELDDAGRYDWIAKITSKHPEMVLRAVEVKLQDPFKEIPSDAEAEIINAKDMDVETFLDFNGHKDSIKSLLQDEWLCHDMNAKIGNWRRKEKKDDENFKEIFNLNYSDAAVKRCYEDDDIMKYPLAYRARQASVYFAKLADVFLAIEKCYEKAKKGLKQ